MAEQEQGPDFFGPGTTGRTLVALEPDMVEAGANALSDIAGLSPESAEGGEIASAQLESPEASIVFPNLGGCGACFARTVHGNQSGGSRFKCTNYIKCAGECCFRPTRGPVRRRGMAYKRRRRGRNICFGDSLSSWSIDGVSAGVQLCNSEPSGKGCRWGGSG